MSSIILLLIRVIASLDGSLASPFATLRTRTTGIDDLDSKEEMCHTHDMSNLDTSAASRSAAWYETQAGIYLDWYLSEHDAHDWPLGIQNEIGVVLPEPDLADNTLSPELCELIWESDGGPAYYVLIAAGRAKSMLDSLQEALDDGTVSDNVDVRPIWFDFQGYWPVLVLRPARYLPVMLGGAFMMAIGEVDEHFRLPLMGIVGSTFGAQTPMDTAIESDAEYLDGQISVFWDAVSSQIDTARATILSDEGDPSMLAGVGLGHVEDLQTDIAKFFTDGRYLLDNPDNMINALLDRAYVFARQAVVATLLKESNYVVFWNTGKDEDDCGLNYGDIWLEVEDGYGCFNLPFLSDSFDNLLGEYPWPGLLDVMVDNYGFDIGVMFQNAYSCYKSADGLGGFDSDTLRGNTELPICFFNFAIIKGTIDWNISNEFGDCEINTSAEWQRDNCCTDC